MFGLNYNKVLGEAHFWLLFIAVNLVFLPMHFLGLNGMPRRIPEYPDAYLGWNMVSSWGSVMSVISVVLGLYSVLVQLTDGENIAREEAVTPDYLESNNTRETRDSDLELILSKPAQYHTYSELPILIERV